MKRALVALLPLLVVAACSSGTGVSSESGNTEVATGGKQFSTADAETAKLGTDAGPGDFPRTITHARGDTVIAAKPQRVVVLDGGELDDVLALGLVPVGTASPEGAGGQPSYLKAELDGVPEVGITSDPNIEAIAALRPDLILGSKLRVDKLYDQLAAIAPTVFGIRPGFPWKENFLLVGDALGEEQQAEQILNDYQAKADEVRASLTGTPTVSMVRFMPGRLRLYGNLSFIGVILKDVGLPRPQIQDIDELAVEISPETITQADGDRIFYSSYGDPASTGEKDVVDGALWKSIPAVAQGNAQQVSDELWFLALGPTGAMLVLDDLAQRLAS